MVFNFMMIPASASEELSEVLRMLSPYGLDVSPPCRCDLNPLSHSHVLHRSDHCPRIRKVMAWSMCWSLANGAPTGGGAEAVMWGKTHGLTITHL